MEQRRDDDVDENHDAMTMISFRHRYNATMIAPTGAVTNKTAVTTSCKRTGIRTEWSAQHL